MTLNCIVRQRSGFAKTKFGVALMRIVRSDGIAQGPSVE